MALAAVVGCILALLELVDELELADLAVSLPAYTAHLRYKAPKVDVAHQRYHQNPQFLPRALS